MSRLFKAQSVVLLVSVLIASGAHAAETRLSGPEIYKSLCVNCHGSKGEGVAGKSDEPLHGDRSLERLTKYINDNMPEDDPGKCVGEDAARVAKYIYDAFYSRAARARNFPARVELSRLTVEQYLNTVADLLGSFREPLQWPEKRGLRAEYFNSRNFNKGKRILERVDARVEFDFGEEPPVEKITTNEFAIRWRGAILADETGDYEFTVRTGNGFRLWINDDDTALIDGWVSSGGVVQDHKATMRLLGGRPYLLRLEYFKFKDKSASISLQWRPPHKARETIPERNLAPESGPRVTVIATSFPPDDSSVGYERGTSVSKAWDQATTRAALEVADETVAHLNVLAKTKNDASDRKEQVSKFCERFAATAFRRPLTEEQRKFFVDRPLASTSDLENAVKRVVILVMKSPRFLYLGLDDEKAVEYDSAARLSFALWDSLPDTELTQAAAAGRLGTPELVEQQIQRMLPDLRTKAKLRSFFHHWLEMEEAEDISKDTQLFPDFDELLLSDLRTSLDVFLEEIVWSDASDYRQILVADYLFLNERLAKFYGVEFAGGTGFQKVAFDPRQRAGVVTHPYLLSAFAYHKSSSPIHRGVFLTRNVLGRSLKPPPMAIQFMDGTFDPSLTMREKVSELTRPMACQGCHAVINPLGFSLEHYDAVGRYRTTDKQKPIDASSDYTTADGKIVRLTGGRDVAEHAAGSDDAQRGFIEQLFHFTVKQPVAAYGAGTLDKLRQNFVRSDYNIQQLLVEAVKLAAAARNVEKKEQAHAQTKPTTIHP